ncbi:hypothetical protein BJ991_002096 [Microbacterium immunditiarum]|uniref:HTH merR-type domain-containing protein n=1 Tax=Microbacterium immunditiarum TaxID=337480 RepID=A0A7Y9GP26_9MICO|nr:hypothetical protein [Microbacterium immunditiarum]
MPEGERLGANRTDYDEAHVQRARLVRALLTTGGLTISAARDVLGVLDSHHDLVYAFAAVQHALDAGRPPGSAASRDRVDEVVLAKGWHTSGGNPGLDTAARALDAFDAISAHVGDDYLAAYADAAERIAQADLALLAGLDRPDHVVEAMVVGTVMGDSLIAGLRRLAQEHETSFVSNTKQDRRKEST